MSSDNNRTTTSISGKFTVLQRLLDEPSLCTLDHVTLNQDDDEGYDKKKKDGGSSQCTNVGSIPNIAAGQDEYETTAPCHQNNTSPYYYWLCHNKADDVLSVAKSSTNNTTVPFNISQLPDATVSSSEEESPSSQYRVLKLSLFNPPSPENAATMNDDDDDRNNMIGTKILYEDSWIRIWEFRLQPQQKCEYHVHKLRYFFTNISSSSVTQELNQQSEPVVGQFPKTQKQGQTFYVDKDNLGSHGVLNVGTTLFLQFIVEFKWQ